MSFFRLVPLWAVLLLAACAAPDAGTRYELASVVSTPFQYRAEVGGGHTLAAPEADSARSTLYYRTDAGLQYLTTPVGFDASRTTFGGTYATTDGRTATVSIDPQPHGGFRMAVFFAPDTGIVEVGQVLAAAPDEQFHGLTMRVRGNRDGDARDPNVPVALGRRGEVVEMQAQGTISLQAPFYLSTHGYGLFVEGTWTGRFDLAASDSERVRVSFDGPSLAYHVFPGSTPAQIHRAYVEQVRPPLRLPDWAFGPWRWRDNHTQQDTLFDGSPYRGPINSMVYEDLAMLDRLDIPLSVYFVDRPWATGAFGYDRPTWDRKRLPNPEAMVDWIGSQEVRFMLWAAPWVMGETASEALARGYALPSSEMSALGVRQAADFVDLEVLRAAKPGLIEAIGRSGAATIERATGVFFGEPLNGDRSGAATEARRDRLRTLVEEAETVETLRPLLSIPDYGRVLIDFTNPDARTWWQGLFQEVLEAGVTGFKMDRSEELTSGRRDVFAHDGRSMAELRNAYPVLYAEALYEATRAVHGDDALMMPRAGYPGSHTVAFFWSGDAYNTWIGFRNALIGGLRTSVMGYPFWTTDTGGYFTPTDRSVLARWLAFSTFSPVMSVGPTSDRAPWDMPAPPTYDEELIAIYRLYSHLREHLRPYTLQLADQAAADGTPLVRPLYYAFPDDTVAAALWDQYLYGDRYLVAPVLDDVSTREVYLPVGSWTDLWDPTRTIEGPTTLTVETPLHKIPVFFRADTAYTLPNLQALYTASLERARQRPAPGDGTQLNALPAFSSAD